MSYHSFIQVHHVPRHTRASLPHAALIYICISIYNVKNSRIKKNQRLEVWVLITFSSVPFQPLRSSLHAVSIMSLAARADGHYG